MVSKKQSEGDTPSYRLLRVVFSDSVIENLSEPQRDVLNKLVVEELRPVQIKERRNTSIQAVRKIISKLRAKGLIDVLNRPNTDVKQIATPKKGHPQDVGGSYSSHPQSNPKKYRLHGQCMTLSILKTSKKYWKLLEGETQKPINNNTVMLHRNKLVIYSNQSFYENDSDECFVTSNAYWTQFFRILENELGVVVIRGRFTKIYQFRCHIAKVGDRLAKKVIKEKLKYEVIDDLGRVRLIIDNSKNLFEKEAVDHRLCQDDMRRIGNFELDMLEMKEDLPLSSVADFMNSTVKSINGLVMYNKNNSEAQVEYNNNIKLHTRVQQEQLITQKEIQKLLKKLNQAP